MTTVFFNHSLAMGFRKFGPVYRRAYPVQTPQAFKYGTRKNSSQTRRITLIPEVLKIISEKTLKVSIWVSNGLQQRPR